MSRTVLTETRSQLALQSYLDGLLQEAAIELADSVSQDEFQAAVLEEQLRIDAERRAGGKGGGGATDSGCARRGHR